MSVTTTLKDIKNYPCEILTYEITDKARAKGYDINTVAMSYGVAGMNGALIEIHGKLYKIVGRDGLLWDI